MPYYVVEERCKGCGACINDCPVGAIYLKGDNHAYINSGECLDCGTCESSCPFSAIEAR